MRLNRLYRWLFPSRGDLECLRLELSEAIRRKESWQKKYSEECKAKDAAERIRLDALRDVGAKKLQIADLERKLEQKSAEFDAISQQLADRTVAAKEAALDYCRQIESYAAQVKSQASTIRGYQDGHVQKECELSTLRIRVSEGISLAAQLDAKLKGE